MTVRPGKSSVFSLLRKTCNDGDDRTDFGKLFQTDAAVAGKVRSPVVERTVRGKTSADVVEERSRRRALMCDFLKICGQVARCRAVEAAIH